MTQQIQRSEAADGRPSQMTIVGIERRADGVLVVHAPTPRGMPPRTYEVYDPNGLWIVVRDLLNDPTMPRVMTERAGDASLEEVVGKLAGDLFTKFVAEKAPYLAPAARQAVRVAGEKVEGAFDSLRKADLPFRYYPKGT